MLIKNKKKDDTTHDEERGHMSQTVRRTGVYPPLILVILVNGIK